MRNKIKYILIIFLLLDLTFLIQWGILKYNKKKNIDNDSKIENELFATGEYLLLLNYGETIINHSLKDISNEIVSISSHSNEFKYIYFSQAKSNNVKIEDIIRINEIKDSFKTDRIKWVIVIIGDIDLKKNNELYAIQKKYGIVISNISKELAENIYKISNSKCGYNLLLDQNNKVRLAHPSLEVNIMKRIIKQELKTIVKY